ncbi:ABC transporter permease [Bacillus niameyensis]|uniref:ABC transporter permease n=1 Tax=Bacillus niameyensis TaxID=1522308 RepID=UPI000782929F|nr:ABC transporter permease [Bacillus niameyensis]
MKSIDELWKERIQAYIQNLRKYFKYMFNDHILFVLIFGGGAAIYYYPQWVKTLEPSFPVAFIMAVLLALVLSASPITTLLKQADIVFLLPLETKLGSYFRKGIGLSFFTQAYLILIVLAACMPMYVHVTGNKYTWFFYLLLISLTMKIWNIVVHWWMLKMSSSHSLIYDWIIRFAMNALLFYFVLKEASLWFIGAVVLIQVVFTMYLWKAVQNKGLKWETLIEKEQGRMQAFYHVANMFTDVPHLKGRVKRRKWLDPIFSSIPYDSKETFRFLYSRTIMRTSEFSGLIIRLTLISALIILFAGNLYLSIAVSLLFLYLTGFQLFPMLKKHDFIIWTSLYPIAARQKQSAFLDLLLKTLVVQAVLFGVCAWLGGNIIQGGIVAGVSIAFAILFSKAYAPSRIKKLEIQGN